MKQLNIKNAAFILLACMALIACGGSGGGTDTAGGGTDTGGGGTDTGGGTVLNLAPNAPQDGYIQFVEKGYSNEDGSHAEPHKYKMYIGDDVLTFDSGWRTDAGVSEYFTGNFEINGEPVETIYAETGGRNSTETIFGILKNDEGDLVVFQNMYFDVDDASGSVTTVQGDEISHDFEDFFEGQDWNDFNDEDFDIFRESGTVAYSYSMSDVVYSYVTIGSNGLLREHDGYNGSVNFDSVSGGWNAELGAVDLQGVADGQFVSGDAIWNGINGSFNGTSVNEVEYLVEDPNKDTVGHIEVEGVFSGTDGSSGFAGGFSGSNEVHDYE